jgi:hypothetical protein
MSAILYLPHSLGFNTAEKSGAVCTGLELVSLNIVPASSPALLDNMGRLSCIYEFTLLLQTLRQMRARWCLFYQD